MKVLITSFHCWEWETVQIIFFGVSRNAFFIHMLCFYLILGRRCTCHPTLWSCWLWQHAGPAGQQVRQPWLLLQYPLRGWVCHAGAPFFLGAKLTICFSVCHTPLHCEHIDSVLWPTYYTSALMESSCRNSWFGFIPWILVWLPNWLDFICSYSLKHLTKNRGNYLSDDAVLHVIWPGQ